MTTKNPISEKQLTANQTNARKSKGPITPQGKINSGQASAKHTILTDTILIDNESRQRFNKLINSLSAEFQPQTAAELIYVQKMAVAHWNTTRLWSLQSNAINIAIRDRRKNHPEEDTLTATTHAVHSLTETGRSLDGFTLQMQRFDYLYNHSIQGIYRHRKENQSGASHQLNENKETDPTDHPISEPADPILRAADPILEPIDPIQ